LSRVAADWVRVLNACGVRPTVSALWGPVFFDTLKPTTFSKGPAELVDFLPEILHESAMLERMVENLNYSTAARLCAVWPTRFPTQQVAQPYVSQPEALANLVYGRRMGNVHPGDGWLYRGRSPIGITGLANYLSVGKLVGQDLDVNPDLLAQPHFALEACIAWREDRVPDSMLGETTAIRNRVNGGSIGLAEVKALSNTVRAALARYHE
jgi:putative chitinase